MLLFLFSFKTESRSSSAAPTPSSFGYLPVPSSGVGRFLEGDLRFLDIGLPDAESLRDELRSIGLPEDPRPLLI